MHRNSLAAILDWTQGMASVTFFWRLRNGMSRHRLNALHNEPPRTEKVIHSQSIRACLHLWLVNGHNGGDQFICQTNNSPWHVCIQTEWIDLGNLELLRSWKRQMKHITSPRFIILYSSWEGSRNSSIAFESGTYHPVQDIVVGQDKKFYQK